MHPIFLGAIIVAVIIMSELTQKMLLSVIYPQDTAKKL